MLKQRLRYYITSSRVVISDPDFKQWFNGSKVVGPDGKPMVMYHGTSHPRITKFEVGYNSFGNKDFKGNHKVISFTSDPEFANRYAGDNPSYDKSPVVYPVYIRSVNPGDFRDPRHVQQIIDMRADGIRKYCEEGKTGPYSKYFPDSRVVEELEKFERRDVPHIKHGAWQYWEDPRAWAQFGWDGAWTREDLHHVHRNVLNFAVADGKQIRSAVGNHSFG